MSDPCHATIPDSHFPEHDRVVCAAVLGVCAYVQPISITHQGDLFSTNCMSSHPAESKEDLEMRSLDWWRREVVDSADWLFRCATYGDTRIEPQKINRIKGNHEDMWDREIGKKQMSALASRLDPDPAFAEWFSDFDYTAIPWRQGAGMINGGFVEIIPEKKFTAALVGIHGWSTAKNPGPPHLEASCGVSVSIGHCHRRFWITRRSPISGRSIECFCDGLTGALTPLYATERNVSNHSHGMGLSWEGKDSYVHQHVPIINGIAILEGGVKIDGRDFAHLVSPSVHDNMYPELADIEYEGPLS